MPEKETVKRARKDADEGKSPSTQAGEFIREEMDHIREGKHGARSAKQAIAIGLSKARRAGVKLPPPKAGGASEKTRAQAARETADSGTSSKSVSKTRSKATTKALKREGLRNPVEGDHDSGAKSIRIPAAIRSPIPEPSRSVIPG